MRYRAAFRLYASEPFTWGRSDCVQFVARVVRHVHGIDYAAGFQYGTRRAAYRILREHGGFSGLLEHILGKPRERVMDGDIVLCDLEKVGEFLGIYMQDRVIAKTTAGAIALPASCISRGWPCRT